MKEQKVRKSVPRGFGKKKEKPGPREDFQGVHQIRNIRVRILEASKKAQELIDKHKLDTRKEHDLNLIILQMVPALKHWLMDWEHHFRMNDMPDEQDVVYTLLKSLEEKDEARSD